MEKKLPGAEGRGEMRNKELYFPFGIVKSFWKEIMLMVLHNIGKEFNVTELHTQKR